MSLTVVSACRSGGGDGGASGTYIVGGSVAGLSGEVVVQNNGGDALTIGANGSFNFPAQLVNGASYAVTIQREPSTQKCAVVNGAGVVRGNVTNVQVNCATLMGVTNSTPLDAAVGVPRSLHPELYFSADINPGTATAANVTLNDGSANVSAAISVVDSVVTVRPHAPLKPFTDHTLTVSTGIRGLSGEVIAAPATLSFSTSDIAWTEPVEFPYDAVSAIDLAMDAAGNVLAAWRQPDGMAASQYVIGSGWSAPVSISGPVLALGPQIEVDGAGNAIAFWGQASGGKRVIWVNRYVAGTGWGTATTISDPAMHSDRERVAFDATGNAIAVWQQAADSNQATPSNAFASFYTFGIGWGSASSIQVDTSMNGKSPTVAVDPNGNAIIVWTEVVVGGFGASNARDSRYVVGTGARLSETLLPKGSYEFSDAGGQVGVDAAGNAVFLWTGNGPVLGSHYPVVSHYSAASGWTVGTAISECCVGRTQLVVNADGDAFAMWVQGMGSLWSNRYDAGTGWGTPVMLWDPALLSVPGSFYGILHEQLAIDAAGNGIAVWYEEPDGPGVLRGPGSSFIASSRHAVGRDWGSRTELAVGSGPHVNAPRLAANAGGKAFVVWAVEGAGWFHSQTL